MKKKTWGIILIVLAIMGVAGGLINGSLLAMGGIEMIGFFVGVALLVFFGIKLINKGE